MVPPLVQLSQISLRLGSSPLLDGVELTVAPGERVCLVGRNGSGKSTLLKIAAGLVDPDRGTRFVEPSATIRYLPQEPDLSGCPTTLAYVEEGLGPGDDPHRARFYLDALGLTGEEDPARLSGGEARRAALARVLAPAPDILLLDEPTNHLDLTTIEWLEQELEGARSALVLISHDRRFLETLSRATVWLDRGQARRLEQGFGAFEAWRDEVLAQEETEQHKLGRKIEAEQHWLRYGVTGRRKRNVRRLGQLQELRQERRDYRGSAGKAVIDATAAEKSGALVIEAEGIGKSFAERPIITDFSIRIMRGDRIGIVGGNGAGKTTLINVLSGGLPPDSGQVRIGANVQMATLDQGREALDPRWTLSEALTDGRGDTVTIAGQSRHVVGYMRDFLFAPEQARTPLGVLSGGERGRLTLARALAKPSNLLVLDEPTNDLDLETLDVLEEMIGDYAGTVILISHDRDFLDRTVNAVLVADGDGSWTEYAGGYSDMLAQRGHGLGEARPAAAKPASRAAAKKPALTPAEGAPSRRRLGFNEKHALETLPARIAALQSRIGALQLKLDDPGLYARDRQAFAQVSDSLSTAQRELTEAEEKWLNLEILREEIEGR